MFDSSIRSLWVINPELIGKDIVFYGAGEVSHKLYRTMVRSGKVNLIGVYDEECSERKTIWGGTVPRLTKNELINLDRDILILIASDKVRDFQIGYQELTNLGFHNIIANVWPAIPKLFDIDESKRLLDINKNKIEKARNLLCDDMSRKVFDGILKYRVSNDVNNLIEVFEYRHKQYFPGEDIMVPSKDEVFMDVGCLNTLTIADLKNWTNDTYKKVYAFEPSKEDKIIVDEYIDFMNYRAESVDAGLYNFTGEISFSSGDLGTSRISRDGDEMIRVVKLDDFMKDKSDKVTFIKMDIEGSELAALEGAVETIGRDLPKLAICVYHKFEDIWELPLWIHEHYPKYRFYLRHYTMTNNETVLYAVSNS